MVDEPTVEDTISILRGLKERYEVFHGVKITDSALVTAAVLSNRYITDRFLPDKAIDLVDEACAMIKTELDSMPAELDEMNRKNLQNCVMSLIPEKRSGAPKRMQLTMSARSESRLRAQRRRSRQHSVTQIMKKLRNCSTVNCLDYRKNWKLRKINSKTVICLWYTKMSPMKRLQRLFPAGRESRLRS